MTECCEYHASGHSDYYVSTRQNAIAAKARFTRRGAANAGDVHLIARLHLGLLDDAHVACQHCGVLDYRARSGLQAALNWPEVPAERLRQDAYGRIFSIAPETDYIRLCIPCHRRLDSWRKALSLRGIAPADVVATLREMVPRWEPS
jgi:hypothetical protein